MPLLRRSPDIALAISLAGSSWATFISARSLCTSALSLGDVATKGFPSPFGYLSLLVLSTVVSTTIFKYHEKRRKAGSLKHRFIQTRELIYKGTFEEDMQGYLKDPEAKVVPVVLLIMWMFRLIPPSYYDASSLPSPLGVLKMIFVTDFFTYAFHILLHTLSQLFQVSHIRHHQFKFPQLFNAFHSTFIDTMLLIIIPIHVTVHLVQENSYTFAIAGTLYANQFTLIHSEFDHDFDPYLRKLGILTAADHHVHHALGNKNYGHFFRVFDMIGATYKAPSDVEGFRAKLEEES